MNAHKQPFIWLPLLGLIIASSAVCGAAAPEDKASAPATTKLDVAYKSVAGKPLRLDLHYPAAPKTGAKYPLVLFTHGGGWAAGSKTIGNRGVRFLGVSALNARGFCVASVDYRLCTKDGNIRMRDCVIDAKDALRFLAKNAASFAIDPERVFTWGDSAGGHLAQMLLLSPPESFPGDPALADAKYRLIAGVSWYGPSDFEKTELFNGPGQTGVRDRFGARIVGPTAKPETRLAAYREVSPVNYLRPDSPPLLMMQGDLDTTIPVHHAHYMKERAAAVKAPVEVFIVKNSGHNWRKSGGELEPSLNEIMAKTAGFLRKQLDLDSGGGSGKKQSLDGADARKRLGVLLTPKGRLPQFTWDRVPLYMHIRKATSYTEEEIKFLARFPLITFEKSNGYRDSGSVEAGTLKAAREVKAVNPNATILYYRNVIVHYGGYAVDRELEQIPGALLHDRKGDTRLVRKRVPAYDLSNPDLRAWWVNSCRTMTADPAIDGLFLDGNVKALEPGYLAREIGAAKKRQTVAGYHRLMKETRQAIGPDKLMLANILRARFDNAGLEYLDYFDGSYLEGFFHNVGSAGYEAYVAKGIDAIQKAARQGKIIAFTTAFSSKVSADGMGLDEAAATVESDTEARAALIYPLALFLVCAEEHSYFRIHEGYSADDNNRWMRWLPEYDRPLGPPNGPARKEGFRYTRTFAHATVDLDIQKRTASIEWR